LLLLVSTIFVKIRNTAKIWPTTVVCLNVHQLDQQPWRNHGILILATRPLMVFGNLFRDQDQKEESGDIAQKWLGYGSNVCFYIHYTYYDRSLIEYVHDKVVGKIDNDAHHLNINSIRLQMLLSIDLNNTIDWDNLTKIGPLVTDLLLRINKDINQFTVHVMDSTACDSILDGLTNHKAILDKASKLRDEYERLMSHRRKHQ